MSAVAARAGTTACETASACAPGPIASRQAMRCATTSSRPKAPAASGTPAGIRPVGDVDVVLGQQRFERATEPGGEVAGQRRDHQHARPWIGHVLGEAPERAEGRGEHRLLPHLNRTAADAGVGEPERWFAVRGAGAFQELERGCRLRQGQRLRATVVPRSGEGPRCPGRGDEAGPGDPPGPRRSGYIVDAVPANARCRQLRIADAPIGGRGEGTRARRPLFTAGCMWELAPSSQPSFRPESTKAQQKEGFVMWSANGLSARSILH